MLAKGFVRFGELQPGVQWKNVSASTYDGEGSAFLAASHKLGNLQLSGSVAYKFATGIHGPTDSDSFEFIGTAVRKFHRLSARINAIFSPDDLGSARRSLFVEAGPAVQLAKGWTPSASIGHRSRQNGLDYTAFNAGISKGLGPALLDLRYHDTNRSGEGDFYKARIVGSVKLSF